MKCINQKRSGEFVSNTYIVLPAYVYFNAYKPSICFSSIIMKVGFILASAHLGFCKAQIKHIFLQYTALLQKVCYNLPKILRFVGLNLWSLHSTITTGKSAKVTVAMRRIIFKSHPAIKWSGALSAYL